MPVSGRILAGESLFSRQRFAEAEHFAIPNPRPAVFGSAAALPACHRTSHHGVLPPLWSEHRFSQHPVIRIVYPSLFVVYPSVYTSCIVLVALSLTVVILATLSRPYPTDTSPDANMTFSRLFHGMLRIVACGAPMVEEDSCDEDVAIEIDVGSVDVESVSDQPQPPRRVDSLEAGYQTVMNRAWTFAHKWSQPERRQELLAASRMSNDETDSDSGKTIGVHRGANTRTSDNVVEMQGDCATTPIPPPLEVVRDSSQARFEQLMHRTTRFYERCSMLQQRPELLMQ